jgi:hypothetical protein
MRVEHATQLVPAPEASSSIVDSDFVEEYGLEAGAYAAVYLVAHATVNRCAGIGL